MRVLAITTVLLAVIESEALVPITYIPPESNAVAFHVSAACTTRHQAMLASTANTGSALPSEISLLLPSNLLAVASTAPAAPSSASTPVAPVAQQSNTASGVFIADINFNGNVPTVEADEYVVVTNGSKAPIDVSGYYLYVATTGNQGPTFTFPKGAILKPASSVRIYTNEIHKESGGYSFGSGKALWNNRGGLAVFKDTSGKKIGEFKYKPASTA